MPGAERSSARQEREATSESRKSKLEIRKSRHMKRTASQGANRRSQIAATKGGGEDTAATAKTLRGDGPALHLQGIDFFSPSPYTDSLP